MKLDEIISLWQSPYFDEIVLCISEQYPKSWTTPRNIRFIERLIKIVVKGETR